MSNVYMYDIARDRWTEVASMKEKRYTHSCLTIDGTDGSESKVLVCGGYRDDCEIWTNGKWTNGPTIPSTHNGAAMVKPSFKSQYAAFVVGGREISGDTHTLSNKIYGIKKDLTSVTMLGTFQQARRWHVAVKIKCQ